MEKVLITAINSFTGTHLKKYLENNSLKVVGTTFKDCDITKKDDIIKILNKEKPDYIIHLAGISFVNHGNNEDFYKVNTIGTTNLLDAIIQTNINPKKIIIASSATVYGNQDIEVLSEDLNPFPSNHYGASKYSMECLVKNYFDKLPIIITRPFNYTGVNQEEHFLIPKIVSHYKCNKKFIELGNIYVKREFNDVDFVCEVYLRLLKSIHNSTTVNIATQNPIALLDVIKLMNKIAGYEIEIKINEDFVRKNEIVSLCGSSKKLFHLIGDLQLKPFKDTLTKMYEE